MTTNHTRVAALDGFRGVAVLLVMANHAAGGHFTGGGLGVDLFFVLSGYLITTLLLDEQAKKDSVSFYGFYVRRGLRLLPALLLVVTVVAVVVRVIPGVPPELVQWRDIWGPLLYVQNWVVMAHHNDPSMLPHVWSLAVEEQFYLLWPLVVLLLSRASRRTVIGLLIGLAGLGVAVMVVRSLLGAAPETLFAGPEGRGGVMLLCGAAVAYWARTGVEGPAARVARRGWPVAALVLAVLVARVNQQSPILYLGGWAVVALVVTVLLIATLQSDTLLARALAWAPLRWVGSISYGLYLWSVPTILLVAAVLKPQGYGSGVVAAIAVPASVALAVLSFILVERPVAAWGRRRFLAVDDRPRHLATTR